MILHYITANDMGDPSVVIPMQGGIHVKPLAHKLIDRHGYRPA